MEVNEGNVHCADVEE